MFPRTVLLLLFSCIASSMAKDLLLNLETATEPSNVSSLSEVEILLSIAACALASVAIVIVPTLVYYKLWNKQLQDEVY